MKSHLLVRPEWTNRRSFLHHTAGGSPIRTLTGFGRAKFAYFQLNTPLLRPPRTRWSRSTSYSARWRACADAACRNEFTKGRVLLSDVAMDFLLGPPVFPAAH